LTKKPAYAKARDMPFDTKPTLHDVGALAGVAARTVSRVINREPGVSDRTALKVRRAIEELNFRPNLAARALRGDRSLLVAIINSNPWPRYVADVVRGVSMACRQAGTYLTFEEFSPDDEHIAASMASFMDNVGIAGTILIPLLADDEELLDMLERRGVRTVRMSPARDIGRTDAVISRDEEGISALVDHLVALNHRKFGYIAGAQGHASSEIRADSFRKRLHHHGIDWSSVLFAHGDFSYISGAEATRHMLARDRKQWPTVICAANDEMAAGVISVLGTMGIRVPQDIAVTGFDDNDIARLIWPPLTTVRQSVVDQAYSATQLLLDRTSDEPRCIEHGVELIIRQSTSG
jgi:LacI family transcriptional regulator